MIGRRSAVGLALLFALAFCAFAAQGALAQVGTKAVNTTAVTCIFVGPENGEFEDEHCDVQVGPEEGAYEHQSVANDQTKELDVVNATTVKLNATLAGVATEVVCSKMKTPAEKSFVHNVETSGKHTMTGNGKAEFTECTVNKPAKCVVKEPIKADADFQGVEGLGAGKNEMGVEFVGLGASKTISELTFENKGAEKCALLNGGKAFAINGSAIGTSPTSSQTSQYTGATIEFGPGKEMETLEMGLKPATVEMTVEPFGGAGGENPIPLTTTT